MVLREPGQTSTQAETITSFCDLDTRKILFLLLRETGIFAARGRGGEPLGASRMSYSGGPA
jgi:hypothetical protein